MEETDLQFNSTVVFCLIKCQKLNPEIYFHTLNSTFFVHFQWKMVRKEKLGEASSAPQEREGPPSLQSTSD